MTPHLERILHIAAWSNLVGTLVVLILMGMAGDAQAAGVEDAAAGFGALAALGAFLLLVFLSSWSARALREVSGCAAPAQSQAPLYLGWGVVAFLLAALLLPSMAQAADGAMGGLVAMNLWHFAINLIYAVAAIAALFAVLRVRDKLLRVQFRAKVVPIIHRSGVATAIYYGVWVLAGAIILARAFA